MKKINKINKQAFSLIEILQTVVLVGIIAGLSVSFFKKVNNDDKLMLSTTKLVMSAIEEANLQMCSDETPYCMAGFSPLNDNETPTEACRRYYQDNALIFDSALGYCMRLVDTSATPPDSAPTLDVTKINNFDQVGTDGDGSKVYKYEYVYTEEVKDPSTKKISTKVTSKVIYVKVDNDGLISYCEDENCNTPYNDFGIAALDNINLNAFQYVSMHRTTDKQGREVYYAPLPCIDSTMNYRGESTAMHNVTCINNVPQWTAYIRRKTDCWPSGQCPNDATNGYPVAEICYRLWDIINHKPQTKSLDAAGNILPDLYWTCVQNNPCINSQDCDTDPNAITNRPNMILPNGARLYNLACVANVFCAGQHGDANFHDYQHIFIKADRVPDDRTFKFKTTSTGIINAVKWSSANNIWDGAYKDAATAAGGGNADLQKAGKVMINGIYTNIDTQYKNKINGTQTFLGIKKEEQKEE